MMAHTRGGGIGNMAGSDDRSLAELVAELRERVVIGGGEAHIYSDELERLIETGGIQAIIDHRARYPKAWGES